MNIADEPTSNSQLCALPYRPQLTGTNVNNQCPTQNGVLATCESGKRFFLMRDE
jgi:hypothetical protein